MHAQAAVDAYPRAKFAMTTFGLGVAQCRNMAVHKFLATDHTHLLMVDDSVTIPPDTIERLLGHGSPITCGCVPSIKPVANHRWPYIAVAESGSNGSYQFLLRWFNGPLKVAACGAACLMIERCVFEKLAFPWFTTPQIRERDNEVLRTLTEDLDFCERATEAGFDIVADGDVRCGHFKTVDVARMISGEPVRGSAARYGSHVPVLQAIARYRSIKTVLEYGCGPNSTAIFLDRRYFPDVVSVTSYESDSAWQQLISKQYGHDLRLDLLHQSLDQMLDKCKATADLVLIDCASTGLNNDPDYYHRAQLYRSYENDERAIVVLHDTEQAVLSAVIERAAYAHSRTHVPHQGPWTTIASNAHDLVGLAIQDGLSRAEPRYSRPVAMNKE